MFSKIKGALSWLWGFVPVIVGVVVYALTRKSPTKKVEVKTYEDEEVEGKVNSVEADTEELESNKVNIDRILERHDEVEGPKRSVSENIEEWNR